VSPWAGANDLAVRLSEQYALPMITAYGRNDAVPNSHPHYIGPLGRAGSPEAAAACRAGRSPCWWFGSRLGNFTTYYDQRYIQPGTRLVQIDIDSRDIGRTYPVALGIQADAGEALAALLEGLSPAPVPATRTAWRQETEGFRAQRQTRLQGEANLNTLPLKPQRVYVELRRVLPLRRLSPWTPGPHRPTATTASTSRTRAHF